MCKLIEFMERCSGMEFDNKETVLKRDNYSIDEYPFLGNLAYAEGEIYNGLDAFKYLLPKFETHLHLRNNSSSLERDGEFEDVCLNGGRNIAKTSSRYYRITDYMQYPSPYYVIDNEMIDHNDILVIGCSMSMRTMAYLSLICRSVTVLDPRFFNGGSYLTEALGSDYDAVVCFASSNLLDGMGEYNSQFVDWHVENTKNGTFDLCIEMANNGTMPWNENNKVDVALLFDETDSGIRAASITEGVVQMGQKSVFVFRDLDRAIANRAVSVIMLVENSFYFGEHRPIDLSEIKQDEMLEVRYLSNTIPETEKMYQKTAYEVTVKNTGNSAWQRNDQIRLCLLKNGLYTFEYELPEDTIVRPGDEVSFTITDIELQNEKRAKYKLQMVQEGVQYFGKPEYCDVELAE